MDIANYVTNCNILPYVLLVRPGIERNGNARVVMIEISDEEEEQLDSGETLTLNRGGVLFVINPNLCYAYGEFDLSPNSETIKTFDNCNWFEYYTVKHIMFSKYNYQNHTITSDIKRGRWYDTSNLSTYLPYLYACLNKPKRVAIFKEFMRADNSARKLRQKQYLERNKEKINKRRSEKRKIANNTNDKLSKLIIKFK